MNLYCDNPDCRELISEGNFYFQEIFKEFYHPGDCGAIALAYHSFETGKVLSCVKLKPINRETALNLLCSGKVTQGR